MVMENKNENTDGKCSLKWAGIGSEKYQETIILWLTKKGRYHVTSDKYEW